jgi:hypothetical protein
MELHENRTELERLLADVWNYEDGGPKNTGLRKGLFAVILAGAVLWTSSPSDVLAPVATTLALAPEMTQVDKVSSQNLDEDLDYRIARQTKSLSGWRTFLEAHPNGPHAQAARAEIDRLQPAPPPQPIEVADRSPPSAASTQALVEAAQFPAPPAEPDAVENEPALPPEPVEIAQQAPPAAESTQTPVEAAHSPAPPTAPVAVEDELAPSTRSITEQPLPALVATQAPTEAAQPPAPTTAPVVAKDEPTAPSSAAGASDAVEASAPPPLLPRPREAAAAKSAEPTHHRHWRAEHRQAGQPNVFTILVAQLFHRHRERSDIGWRTFHPD